MAQLSHYFSIPIDKVNFRVKSLDSFCGCAIVVSEHSFDVREKSLVIPLKETKMRTSHSFELAFSPPASGHKDTLVIKNYGHDGADHRGHQHNHGQG